MRGALLLAALALLLCAAQAADLFSEEGIRSALEERFGDNQELARSRLTAKHRKYRPIIHKELQRRGSTPPPTYLVAAIGDVLPYASSLGIHAIDLLNLTTFRNGPLIGFLNETLMQCSGLSSHNASVPLLNTTYYLQVGQWVANGADVQDIMFQNATYSFGMPVRGVFLRKELEFTPITFVTSPGTTILSRNDVSTHTFVDAVFTSDNGATLILATSLAVIFACILWWIDLYHTYPDYTKGVSRGIWYCMVTMSTVGYGDVVPKKWRGKLVACVWIFVGTTMMAYFAAKVLLGLQYTPGFQDAQIIQGLDVSAVIDSPQEWDVQIRGSHVVTTPDVASALALLRNSSVDATAVDTLAAGLVASIFGSNVFRSSGSLDSADDINIMVNPVAASLPAIHPWTGANMQLGACIDLVLARSGYDILEFFRYVKTDFPSNDEAYQQAQENSADTLVRKRMVLTVPLVALALLIIGWLYEYVVSTMLKLPRRSQMKLSTKFIERMLDRLKAKAPRRISEAPVSKTTRKGEEGQALTEHAQNGGSSKTVSCCMCICAVSSPTLMIDLFCAIRDSRPSCHGFHSIFAQVSLRWTTSSPVLARLLQTAPYSAGNRTEELFSALLSGRQLSVFLRPAGTSQAFLPLVLVIFRATQ
eukprot:m.698439 g.698439  ORF g.698439 m.698439 type:complete len:646 (-) comp58684_c0_seq3:74-2011(-)